LNADDPGSLSIRESADAGLNVATFGVENAADVTAEILEESLDGTRFLLKLDGDQVEAETALVGRHNVSNCLAAAAAAHRLGVSLPNISAGIEALLAVPGRLERV